MQAVFECKNSLLQKRLDGVSDWDAYAGSLEAHSIEMYDLWVKIVGENVAKDPSRMNPERYVHDVYDGTEEPWCKEALLVMLNHRDSLLRAGEQPNIPAIREETRRVERETLQ